MAAKKGKETRLKAGITNLQHKAEKEHSKNFPGSRQEHGPDYSDSTACRLAQSATYPGSTSGRRDPNTRSSMVSECQLSTFARTM